MTILHNNFKLYDFIQQKRNIFLNFILLFVFCLPFYVNAQVCPPATSAQVCPAPANFNLMTPCYVNGARTSSPNDDVIVLYNHAAARGTSATKQVLASYSEVGTVWGMAWHAQSKKLYAAAFLKRHCDLSPDGLGAIYEIDVTTPTTAGAGTPTLWMDLNSTTHLGAGATLFPTETAANRGLGAISQPSHDVWAYTRVGKQGLGDIEITPDGTTMYVMDLTNRQVLEINIASKTVTTRYPVNAPANYTNAADRRPFGIKYYNDELYIGVVSSGETSAKKKDVRANVMKLSGSSFVNVYEVDSMAVEPPDHIGEDHWVTSYRGNPNFGTGLGWNYYSDDVMSSTSSYAYIQNPVPLVSDIEFDNSGNMVIGLMDWSGHRMGAFNYRADPAFTTLHNIQVQGDVVRAIKSGSTWVKENGVGDFYNDIKSIPDQAGWQDDTFMGGLTISDCNGTELVVAHVQDPFVFNEGGSIWMKTSDGLMQTNNTGARVSGSAEGMTIAEGSRIRIYQSQIDQPSTFGKAAGLGDIVGTFAAACIIPCPITLSNTAPTCTGATANNDGKITLTAITNADKYAISTGTTFTGSGYASATTIGTLPFDLKTDVPNAGETYTIRFYNAADACYKDTIVTVDAVICSCSLTATAVATNVKCNGGNDGAVNVTVTNGSGAQTYAWDNSTATTEDISGLTAQVYTVTVTDGACTATASVTITEPTALTATCAKTDVTTVGGSDGTATVTASGGTGALTYSWSDAGGSTTASISGLLAGSYMVTVTDANNCTITCTSIVGSPSCSITATASATDVKCKGGNDGAVNVTVTNGSGLQTYAWTNSTAISEDISSLTAQTYTVTVTDGACTATATATVNEPAIALTATCAKTDVTTIGGSDGTATVTASGGTGTLTYLWSDAGGSTTASISGLIAGSYTVTVTDANNCTITCSSTVLSPGCTAPTADAAIITKSTCTSGTSNTDGVISLNNITNGDKYAYNTSGGTGLTYASATAISGTSISITGLSNSQSTPTNYTVRIYNGDESCYTDILATLDTIVCCTDIVMGPIPLVEGMVGVPYTQQISATGGVTPYTYLWFAGTTGTLPDGLSISSSGLVSGIPTTVGSYAVKITVDDVRGCHDELDPAILDILPNCTLPTNAAPIVTNSTCNGASMNSDGSISISGITDGDKYAYNTSGGTGLTYAAATTITGGTISLTGLTNSAAATTYTIRVYNGAEDCYIDIQAILVAKTCSCTTNNCYGVKVIKL